MDDSNLTEKQRNKQRSLANLKPFKPGQSGNPAGRKKKGLAIADILNEVGDMKAPDADVAALREVLKIKKKSLTMREAMIMRAYLQALKGDKDARNFITDRTEGKALERIALNVADSPFELWKSKIEDGG